MKIYYWIALFIGHGYHDANFSPSRSKNCGFTLWRNYARAADAA